MSFLDSIKTQSKKHEFPFDHWEYNNALSDAAINEIIKADIPTKKNDFRIKKFNKLFNQLNIIKKLDNKLETWHYENLDETSRIAKQIKKKLT